MPTNSYCSHRVILPGAVREPQYCWAIHPIPEWHHGRCSPWDWDQGKESSSPAGVQQAAHGWCCSLLCCGKPLTLVGPNIKTDEARSVEAKGDSLQPWVALFTVLLIFYLSIRLRLFWFSSNQERKAACKVLALAELENISEKMETQKDKLWALKGCMRETWDIQLYAKFQRQNKLLHTWIWKWL